MKRVVEFVKKRQELFALSLILIFILSFCITWYSIKDNQDNEYKYYNMPNGTVIKYKGKELVPDENGVIVIPKGAEPIIFPE